MPIDLRRNPFRKEYTDEEYDYLLNLVMNDKRDQEEEIDPLTGGKIYKGRFTPEKPSMAPTILKSAKEEGLNALSNLIEGEGAKLGLGQSIKNFGELVIPETIPEIALSMLPAGHMGNFRRRGMKAIEDIPEIENFGKRALRETEERIAKSKNYDVTKDIRKNQMRRVLDEEGLSLSEMDQAKLHDEFEKGESTLGDLIEKHGLRRSELGGVGKPEQGRIQKLIEQAGGENIVVKGDKISWTKDGKKYSADMTKRFGSRQLGISPRQEKLSQRDLGLNERSPLRKAIEGKDPNTGRGYSKESQRAIDEARQPTQLQEFLNANYAKDVEKGNIRVHRFEDGRYTIQRRYGKDTWDIDDKALAKAHETLKKKPDEFPDIDDPDVEKMYSGIPFTRRVDKVNRARQLPKDLKLAGSYKLESTYGNTPLKFPTEFDQYAYTLAGKQNFAMDRELTKKLAEHLSVTEDEAQRIIKDHGTKLRGIVDERLKGRPKTANKTFDVPARPLIEKTEPEKIEGLSGWLKEALLAPTQFKFGGDISNLLRQSFRPSVLHPIKTGLPGLKAGFKSMFSQKGFDEVMEDLARNSPVYQKLEQYKALPGATEELLPGIRSLNKLPQNDIGAYWTEAAPLEKIPGLGDLYLKPSRRAFDAGQKTIRGKEVERLAEKYPGGLDELLKSDSPELERIINRVSDETGHGTLGERGDRALGLLSSVFTAPRNLAGKFQFYNPLNYLPVENMVGRRNIGNSAVYKDFLMDQAKLGAGIGAGLYGIDKTGVGDVDPNIYSTNFGVKFGNYKPDLFGGEASLVRQLGRTVTPGHSARISGKGEEYDRGEESKGGTGETYFGDLKRFGRARLRPGIPSMIADLASADSHFDAPGINFAGEDISKPYDEEHDPLAYKAMSMIGQEDSPFSRWIAQQFSNANAGDIMDAYKEEGLGTALAAGGLAFLGAGGTSYDPFNPSPYKAKRVKVDVKNKRGNSIGFR